MLQFVREIPIRIVVQGTLSSRRGFLFHMSAGFSKDVEPQSGMSVNLNLVDQWLDEVRSHFSVEPLISQFESPNNSLVSWLQSIQALLRRRAQAQGAVLASLCFREERGWSVSWDHSLPDDKVVFSHSHYVEVVPLASTFELLRVHFCWLRASGCQADYQHEGFKLLKLVSNGEALQLQEQLGAFVGRTLDSGTALRSIQIEYLGEQYTVHLP